jgi:putative heme-binding domain-containing protein
MAQQMLLWKPDPAAYEPLHKLAAESKRPITRAQALWTLALLGQAKPDEIAARMRDEHSGVRRQAIRIAEEHLAESPQLGDVLLERVKDNNSQVELQVAYTLGAWNDPRSGKALGELALANRDDRFMSAAVLSSVTPQNLAGVIEAVLAVPSPAEPPAELLEQLVGLATAYQDEATLTAALRRIGMPHQDSYAAWQLTALAGLLDALAGTSTDWHKYDPDQSLAKMFAFARETALNDEADEGQRIRAIRLLGRSPASQADDIGSLVALLVPQTSGAVQAAAVESLARIDSETIPPALLSGWKGHGPELRSQILEVLLGRPSGQKALLAAIERGEVPQADIDAARRQRLQQSDDEAIRSQAEKLLAGGIDSNRGQVIEQFRSVLAMGGDAAAGAAVFKKRCAVCHRLRGVGVEVGPDLASLTDLAPETLLVAILDPNKAVEAKYRDYLALTNSGITHTGLLASETGNSVTLMGQEGKQQTILRSDLETLQATGKSLMPEGLEKDLSPQDLANVIAHVRGSGAPRKVFEANRPQLVKPTTDGTLQLYPVNCEIYGPTIVMEQLYKNLGEWRSENDQAVWNVELPTAGKYQMVLNYAVLAEDAGNRWVLEVRTSGAATGTEGAKSPVAQLTGTLVATGSLDRYVEMNCGELELPAGAQQITLRASGAPRGELMQFGGVLLKPVK